MKIVKTFTLIMILALTACGGGESGTPSGSGDGGGLKGLLPITTSIAEWDREGETRSYTEGSLWEYINGGADAYLLYGFQEVVTADYKHTASGQDAVIDIYEMQDPLNAFGIYANERNPEYNFEKIGAEGYMDETNINFWVDRYYVKITTFEDNSTISEDLKKLAYSIANMTNSSATEPAELGFFPGENLQKYEMKYIPKDVLGQSYLYNGFEAIYAAGDDEYKMFLIKLDTADEAVSALNRYKEFVSGSGDIGKDVSAPGDGGFVGKDGFYGDMMAVRKGSALGVILTMPSESAGTDMLNSLLSNIQ
ncbi:DUF6599 family protein [candidate division KSB1 bacterium]